MEDVDEAEQAYERLKADPSITVADLQDLPQRSLYILCFDEV